MKFFSRSQETEIERLDLEFTFKELFMAFAIGATLGILVTGFSLRTIFRQEAVKNGVAEYYADQDGDACFRWKKPESEKVK